MSFMSRDEVRRVLAWQKANAEMEVVKGCCCGGGECSRVSAIASAPVERNRLAEAGSAGNPNWN